MVRLPPTERRNDMRFVSQHRRFKRSVREHITMNLANGRVQVIQQGVTCEFDEHDVTEHDKEVARRTFKFRGAYQEQDEATPVDPLMHRLSTYDTERAEREGRWTQVERLEHDARKRDGDDVSPGWLRREVEQALLEGTARGTRYELVEPIVILPPVPNYKRLTTVQGRRDMDAVVAKVLSMVDELGIDRDAVIAWERQNGRKESGPIIAALERVPEPDPDDELVAA
jgi:hypothetical protein